MRAACFLLVPLPRPPHRTPPGSESVPGGHGPAALTEKCTRPPQRLLPPSHAVRHLGRPGGAAGTGPETWALGGNRTPATTAAPAQAGAQDTASQAGRVLPGSLGLLPCGALATPPRLRLWGIGAPRARAPQLPQKVGLRQGPPTGICAGNIPTQEAFSAPPGLLAPGSHPPVPAQPQPQPQPQRVLTRCRPAPGGGCRRAAGLLFWAHTACRPGPQDICAGTQGDTEGRGACRNGGLRAAGGSAFSLVILSSARSPGHWASGPWPSGPSVASLPGGPLLCGICHTLAAPPLPEGLAYLPNSNCP